MNADVVVIGAGLVGAAIAYGLASRDIKVLLLDGGDRDFRASNANFGLVWQQGKGMGMPAYQQWTRTSVNLWAAFSGELANATGLNVEYDQNGGLTFCFSEAAFEQRHTTLLRLHDQLGAGAQDWEMLDRDGLAKLLPQVRLGPDVVGASFGTRDGHANPLKLLRALHVGIIRKGGRIRGTSAVRSLRGDPSGLVEIGSEQERICAERVVIAAGLGSKALAADLAINIPIRPQRGQILVTERLESFLPLPTSGLRQTREGTVMIGATHDEVGVDTSATSEAAAKLCANALRCVPALSEATLVRQWGGLRIMTPDSYPIYTQSESCPGVFVAVCHSGVTLAAAHATLFSEAIAKGQLPESFKAFHQRRFDVSKAA